MNGRKEHLAKSKITDIVDILSLFCRLIILTPCFKTIYNITHNQIYHAMYSLYRYAKGIAATDKPFGIAVSLVICNLKIKNNLIFVIL